MESRRVAEPAGRALAAPSPATAGRDGPRAGPARAWLAPSSALVGLFVVAAAGVSVVTPAFEAPDEVPHFGYVRHLVATGRLPRLGEETEATNEAGQPPLYYVTAALATLPLGNWTAEATRLPTWDDHNPHASFDVSFRGPPDLDNRNLFAHRPDEQFPYRGDALALHLARLVSAAFGVAALVALLLTARELFPAQPAVGLAAGGLLAFNPQFLFVSAVVTNDSAAAATGGLVTWLLVRLVCRGPTVRRSLLLGAALGLALLAKVSLLGLLPVVGLSLLATVRPVGRRSSSDARRGVALIGLTLAAALLGAGWWYGDNWRQHGDPLAWTAMLDAQGVMTRREPLSVFEAAGDLFAARDRYWAIFGWTNVAVEPLVYAGLDVLVVVALAGLTAGAGRRLLGPRAVRASGRAWLALALVALWVLIVLGSLLRWIQLNTAAAQGRLLFPAATGIALLLAVGLLALVPRRAAPVAALLVVAGMAALSGFAFGTALLPAYRPPEPVGDPSVEPGFVRLDVRCGCGVEVVGYRYEATPLAPGGEVVEDVFWRVAERGPRPTRNWSLSVGLIDPAGRELAQRTSWPAGGRLPTSVAPPGAIYRERVRFLLPPSEAAPGAGQLRLAIFDPYGGSNGQAELRAASGEPIGRGVSLGRFRWPGSSPAPVAAGEPIASYQGGLELVGVTVPDAARPPDLPVQLVWRAGRAVPFDYTVSVQAHRPDEPPSRATLVGQSDAQPRGGRYPMTLWLPGETVADPHVVPLGGTPPSAVRLLVIVYRPDTGERLGIVASDRPTVDGEIVEVGQVRLAR